MLLEQTRKSQQGDTCLQGQAQTLESQGGPKLSKLEKAEKLQEVEEAQLSLLLLQKKRNELEQLRTMIALALESGDINALHELEQILGQVDTGDETLNMADQMAQELKAPMDDMLSTMTPQDMPAVADKSILKSMQARRQMKQEELLQAEKDQAELCQSAAGQYEALLQKQKDLSTLQQKLNDITTEYQLEQLAEKLTDEETDVTIMPSKHGRNVILLEPRQSSAATLVPENDFASALTSFHEQQDTNLNSAANNADHQEEELRILDANQINQLLEQDTEGMDEAQLLELQENLQTLKAQEQEIISLRNNLNALQAMRDQLMAQRVAAEDQLEARSKADVSITQDELKEPEVVDEVPVELVTPREVNLTEAGSEKKVSEDQMLQGLLSRLLASSLKTDEIKEGEDSQQLPPGTPKLFKSALDNKTWIEIEQEHDEQDVEAVQDEVRQLETENDIFAANAAERIRESIQQAKLHISELQSAIEATENPQEREAYMDLLEKLQTQLYELRLVEEQFNYYKNLTDKTDAVESAEKEAAQLMVVSPHQVPIQQEELSKSSLPKLEVQSMPRYPSTASRRISSVNMNNVRKMEVKDAWAQKRPMSANIYNRRVSQMSHSGSSSIKSSTKRLFDSHKDEIHREASNLISCYESEPYFLLTAFKKLSQLDSSYLRQKFLMSLDSLLEEKNLMEEEEEDVDEDLFDANRMNSDAATKNTSEAVSRVDVEELIKERIADYVIYMSEDPRHNRFRTEELGNLTLFVVSMLHSSLTATLSSNEPNFEALEDYLSGLVEKLKNELETALNPFLGQELNEVKGDVMNAVLEVVYTILDAWQRSTEEIELVDRYSRWERLPTTAKDTAFESLFA